MKVSKAQHEESILRLREWLPKGTTVYTILRHRSQSGMSCEISLVVFDPENRRPIHPNWHASRVLGLSQGKRDGLKVGGCGTDMGFRVVYELAQAIYGDGKALKQEWL